MKAKMEEEDVSETPRIRLGDASIASPFTSKIPNITATLHIIRQGRCTLVTTLQMYTILALNCLISAYSMSVLFLDGVKYGERQMTIAGLSIAVFFLLISKSMPLDVLSPQRPPSKLFTVYWLLNVMGQFVMHLVVLVSAVDMANPYTPEEDMKPTSTEFKPNVLNTVVYLISTSTTVATFLSNYQGRPFMQSLKENKQLYYTLWGTWILMLLGTLGIIPGLDYLLELAELPDESFRLKLASLLIGDLFVTRFYSNVMRWLFQVKPTLRSRWKTSRLL